MTGGFPLDLILFAMVAAFLVLRLRSVLGRRTGFERPPAPEPRAPGYDPRAAVTLWNKMAGQSAGAPPQWLSTHPSHATRQKDLAEYAARVMPLYQGARR